MKAAAFAMTAFLASTVYADDILLPPMPYAPHSAETTIQELPQHCMDQQFCGVEDTDNVRALNEIRLTIANFRNWARKL